MDKETGPPPSKKVKVNPLPETHYPTSSLSLNPMRPAEDEENRSQQEVRNCDTFVIKHKGHES